MVIPVYILPVMAVIFFTAGGVTARKRKTELEIPDKRKKISCMAKLFRRMMGLMDRSTCLKKSDMKAAGLKQRDAQEQAVFTVCLE